jgi:hypothetical protein
LAWFAGDSSQARARLDAPANPASVGALPHDRALLAWLSSYRLNESPSEVVGSSPHSTQHAMQLNGSEPSSVDAIFTDLASARFFDI